MHIICFGNLLQGDDGFGIHVLQELRGMTLPDHVKLFDGGLMGLSALGYFEDCSRALVVDALANDGMPGRLRVLGLEDVAAPEAAFSAHSLDVSHLFHALPILFEGRQMPRTTIVGAEVEPGDGAFHMELTQPVRDAVPRAVALVMAEIERAAQR